MTLSGEEIVAGLGLLGLLGAGAVKGMQKLGNGRNGHRALPCQNHESRLGIVEVTVGRIEGSISGLHRKLDGYQERHQEERVSLEGRLGELTGLIKARLPEKRQ